MEEGVRFQEVGKLCKLKCSLRTQRALREILIEYKVWSTYFLKSLPHETDGLTVVVGSSIII